MSKPNKQNLFQFVETGPIQNHAEEYATIKKDLIKILVINFVYLIGILCLYYFNLKNSFLDAWLEKLLNL